MTDDDHWEKRCKRRVRRRSRCIVVPRRSIGHVTRSLRGANLSAKVRFGRLAEFTVIALRDIAGDDVIADRDRGHSLSHGLDHSGALMPEHHGEKTYYVWGKRINSINGTNFISKFSQNSTESRE